ncbi:MAG: hypothetical protein JXB14_08050 [Candidatus Altiarchaeota archaeon]|nr:hypothetical protein [Candidatus Altiarchaeota archaeon]
MSEKLTRREFDKKLKELELYKERERQGEIICGGGAIAVLIAFGLIIATSVYTPTEQLFVFFAPMLLAIPLVLIFLLLAWLTIGKKIGGIDKEIIELYGQIDEKDY